jgi:hypothetical protein
MPKFMDFHDGLKLSSADVEQLVAEQAGTTNAYGPASWSSTTTTPTARCTASRRDPMRRPIRRYHAALDVPCGEVQRVKTLL